MIRERKIKKYTEHFDEGNLFKKIIAFSGKAGTNMLFYALILYFLMIKKDIPIRTRLIFVAALGYFILPTDLISDFIPGLGFTDDLTFITYALTQGTDHITPEIKAMAKSKLRSLLNKGTKKVDNQQDIQEDEVSNDGIVWNEE